MRGRLEEELNDIVNGRITLAIGFCGFFLIKFDSASGTLGEPSRLEARRRRCRCRCDAQEIGSDGSTRGVQTPRTR